MLFIGNALEMYKAEHGTYPSTEEGLNVLVTGKKRLLDELPLDPWSRNYNYRYPSLKGGSDRIDLWSYGEDNEPGGSGASDMDVYYEIQQN